MFIFQKHGAFPDFNIVLKDSSDIDRSLLEETNGVVDGLMLTVKENTDSCPITHLVEVGISHKGN